MNRRNLMIGAAGLVVICLAWYVLLWSPKSSDLSKAKSDRTSAQQETSAANLKLAGLQSAARNRDQLQTTDAKLVSLVPNDSELDLLILQINKAAADSGVGFVSVSPVAPTASAAGGPSAITLSLSFQGDYDPIRAFIDKLLSLDRLVVIDSVGLSSQSAATSTSSLAVTMTARVFTDAPPATASGSTAAGSTTTTTPTAGAKSG
jgi:Tfp pilus assembly protein PilO